MSTPSNLSIPNNSGNPPQNSGKGKEKETTLQQEAREQEERGEEEWRSMAWEQAVENAKSPEERAAEAAKKQQQQDADQQLAETLQEEEWKAAERKEAAQKAKAEEKQKAERKRQEKLVKNALDKISVQLRVAKVKEVAVATHCQTLVERDACVQDIFARAGNEELTAEDIKELETILRGESPDNSDVPNKPNDGVDSEPDPNEIQTGKKQKHGGGKKSTARKAPVKRPRKAEASGKGGEVGKPRKVLRWEEIVWGPVPEACGARTSSAEPERIGATWYQGAFRASGINGWLATEIVQWEPDNQWLRVYLFLINWDEICEGEKEDKEKDSEEEDHNKDNKAPDDQKEPEDLSSSESSKGSRVESWRNKVVDEVDNAPVDGEKGGGEMLVDPPVSGSLLADQLPVVLRTDGIKIEVRSEEQMLIDLSQQLVRNWLHKQKVAKWQKEEEEDAEERWKLAALEKADTKLQKHEERRTKEADQAPSIKKETEEGEVPPPAPPRPAVCVQEVNNVVEILDSDDEKNLEGPEESEDPESLENV
ncbi:hypothetical protein C8R45DRAFT_1097954 [Mycena sanguinolenta]|nr:hypothetical protein C8R45DRAFT_1097954 [Mycena sanguinolenta]